MCSPSGFRLSACLLATLLICLVSLGREGLQLTSAWYTNIDIVAGLPLPILPNTALHAEDVLSEWDVNLTACDCTMSGRAGAADVARRLVGHHPAPGKGDAGNTPPVPPCHAATWATSHRNDSGGSIRWGQRPVLRGAPHCADSDAFDAGVCHHDLASGLLSCMPSFVIIGAMKCGTAELQVRCVAAQRHDTQDRLSLHPLLLPWNDTKAYRVEVAFVCCRFVT